MVRRPNIYEAVFALSVDTRAVLPQLIGSDVVKSGWESRDVMTGREDVIRVVLCAAYMLLLTYSREVVVLGGGPAGLVRDRARRTVDPEVWTWQLIRESRCRWRFAGLMEDSPTLLNGRGVLPDEVPLACT